MHSFPCTWLLEKPLKDLHTLSLLSVHLGAVLYLRLKLEYGISFASSKRWAQICKLKNHMTGFAYEPSQPRHRLKLLRVYLSSLLSLQRVVFHWEGYRDPSPLSLAT